MRKPCAPPSPTKSAQKQQEQTDACQARNERRREDTAFEKRLYAACKSIPKGKVATYGGLAAILKSSARAVGQGMRRNPYAPRVPCHRVIASNLALGGFHGSWGEDTKDVQRKRAMLEAEGVRFTKTSKVEADCVCQPPELLLLLPRAAAASMDLVKTV